MKKLLLIFALCLLTSNSYAFLGFVKKALGDEVTNIANQTKNTHSKVTGIESLVKDFKVDVGVKLGRMEANIQGQAGIGNKVENISKDMRDDNRKFKAEMQITMTKIHNEMNNINKTITKTSIKQNQASIFYVLSIILGMVSLGSLGFAVFFVVKFFDDRALRLKYEREIERWRREGKV